MDSVIIPKKKKYIKEGNFNTSLNNTSFSYNFTQKSKMILMYYYSILKKKSILIFFNNTKEGSIFLCVLNSSREI